MKLKNLYSTALITSFIALIAAAAFFIAGYTQTGSTALVAAFILAAIGVRGYAGVSGFAYTLVIFAFSACALTYPAVFITISGYPLKNLVTPLLIVVMFGMGSHLNLHDFVTVVKKPKAVLVGLICHYIIMPGLGFVLAYMSKLPPEIAAGIILVGCSPSGTASNVMAYISGGNLPLSVTVTALSTLMAPLATPLLMKLLAGQLVAVNFWEMLWHITQIVILPVAAGLLYNRLAHGRWPWLDKILPFISMCAIPLIVGIIVAAGRNTLLSIGLILIVLVLIHNLVGYLLGYQLSRLMGLHQDEARTIAFEVGLQNAGLASGIAVKMGMVATMGLAPGVFGSLQNITASMLATWWKKRLKKPLPAAPQSIA